MLSSNWESSIWELFTCEQKYHAVYLICDYLNEQGFQSQGHGSRQPKGRGSFYPTSQEFGHRISEEMFSG